MRSIVFLGLLGWFSLSLAQPSMFIESPSASRPAPGVAAAPESRPERKKLRWNSELFQLPRKHVVRVTTDSGRQLILVHEKTIEHASGNKSWVGRVQGAGKKSRVVITVANEVPVGTINTPEGVIRISPENGYSVMVDSAEEPGIFGGFQNDTRVPPVVVGLAEPAQERAISMRSYGDTVIDVLVMYDNEFAASGTPLAKIDNLIALTNTAYEDSEVDIELRLVYTEQAGYNNASSNGDALDDFTDNLGVFAGLETLRTDVGADLAVFLRKYVYPNHGGCGVAWVGGAWGNAITARHGYSVVSYGTYPHPTNPGWYYYCSDYTFAHELGHNQGSAHDRDHASVDGHFDYSYGYDVQEWDSVLERWVGVFGTVMSYDGPEVGVFSNPNITCPGSNPCGLADGDPNSADNALSLNNTRSTIANFRETVIPLPGGDRDKTLFYFNAIQGAL